MTVHTVVCGIERESSPSPSLSSPLPCFALAFAFGFGVAFIAFIAFIGGIVSANKLNCNEAIKRLSLDGCKGNEGGKVWGGVGWMGRGEASSPMFKRN